MKYSPTISKAILFLVSCCLLSGCTSDTPVSSSSAPRLEAPAAVKQPLDAAVLGGLKTAWHRELGSPTKESFGDLFTGNVVAAWLGDEPSERAWYVELIFGTYIPVAEARRQARRYFPSDAKLVRTYKTAIPQTVEVYKSAQLAKTLEGVRDPLGDSPFGSEPPGTFIQIAQRASSKTSRVVISLGNNP